MYDLIEMYGQLSIQIWLLNYIYVECMDNFLSNYYSNNLSPSNFSRLPCKLHNLQ